MPTTQPAQNNKANILIVDDALSNLQILFSMLTEQGYETRGAQNGPSALMMTEAAPPDLILLDVRMPDMDGYAVCEQLKANPQTEQIPVVFISALDELTDKLRGFEVGGVDYITKPFQIEEVLTRIETHLSLYKMNIRLDAQNTQLQQEISERQQAEARLQQLNKELEARVAERTVDLTTTNEALRLEIANRKAAQESLRKKEKRYRQIFETNQAIKLIVDPDNGCIVEANQAACLFYGYSYKELTGMHISDINIMSDEDVQLEMSLVEQEEKLFFNFKHRLASGEIRDVEVYSGPVVDEEKTLLYSIIHDVTQRKLAEEALQSSEGKLKEAQKIAKLGYYVWDMDTGYWTNSSELDAIWGADETYQKDFEGWLKIVHPDFREIMQVYVQEYVLKQHQKFDKEYKIVNIKTGQEKWVRGVGTLRFDENNNPIDLFGIIQDITERKQIELELQKSQQNLVTAQAIAHIGSWELELSQKTIYWSAEMYRICGFELDTPLTVALMRDLLHPDDAAKFEQAVANTVFEQAPPLIEYRIIRPDGDIRILHTQMQTVRDDDGKSLSIVGICHDVTDKREMENALRESEVRYRELYDSIRDAILVVDKQRNVVNCNPAFTSLFGYTLDELVGNHTSFLYESQEEFTELDVFMDEPLGDVPFLKTVNYKTKTGVVFPGETSLFDVKDDRGINTAFVWLIRDITERKESEKSLRQLSQAIEQSPTSIIITDAEGRIQYVNPKFSQITGYSKAEVIGKNPRILKSGYSTKKEYTQLWNTINAGEIWYGKFHNQRKNGEKFWESAIVSPIIDGVGQITHYLAIKEDITEQEAMRDELLKRNRQLELLNRASQVIGSSLDLDKILVTMLEETRQLLDVNACSVWLLDAETGDLVCKEASDPQSEVMRNWRLAPGQGVAGWAAAHDESVILPNLQEDARHFKIADLQNGVSINSMLTVPLRVEQKVVGVFEVVDEAKSRFSLHDLQLAESLAVVAANAIENAQLHKDLRTQLSRLKEMQTRLIQSEKLAAIGELIAGVAHELNNPLAATILYAQLMQTKGVDAELSHDLDQIVTQAHRASRVVRGLLDFARQRPFERIETQVNDVILRTIDLLAYEIRTHNIDIFTQLEPDLPVTLADPHQLQQVFVNLITNAIQAIDESQIGDRITIHSEVVAPEFSHEKNSQFQPVIRVTIHNDGVDILPEVQSRIFDPFFTTKEPGQGTGLGLSVCHGIVSEHDGRIWVNSIPGEGVTFFIELPIIMPPKKETVHKHLSTEMSSLTLPDDKCRILVVDDEEGVLMVVTRILRRSGYLVDGASNGQVGLDLLEDKTYDLVLCDLRMPEMSGPEFYWEAVKKNPDFMNRVIFTTGDTVSPNTREFLKSVQAKCLLKPFELNDLLSVVQEWFDS